MGSQTMQAAEVQLSSLGQISIIPQIVRLQGKGLALGLASSLPCISRLQDPPCVTKCWVCLKSQLHSPQSLPAFCD